MVYVDESTSMSELVEQGIVQIEQSATEPAADETPAGQEPLTVPDQPVQNPERIPELSVSSDCDCGMDDANIYNHSDNCARRMYYHSVCGGSASDVHGLWFRVNAADREFLEDYLAANHPETLTELYALIEADIESDSCALGEQSEKQMEEYSGGFTGEATATVDGITVDAVGVPEGSSLTVREPSGDALEAVQDAVSNVMTDEQLFVYDISVQNAESDNWQPESGSVELTLTLPGAEKLPKYTPVKIVHVDDEGNASTIGAYVGDGGKIFFETNGFSTFAGFTVDFDYEGVRFSIPGETGIKLSSLFENLKMPLQAGNVADVEYSDYTQIKVEQLEGDWLLTSLKAFDTEERLTLTMADGAVYRIKVTDAEIDVTKADCYFAYRQEGGATSGTKSGTYKICNIDVQGDKGNGYVRLFLNNQADGYVGTSQMGNDGTADPNGAYNGNNIYYTSESNKYRNWFWWGRPVIFDGMGRENPTFTLSLRRVTQETDPKKGGIAKGSTFYLDIWHFSIINGANVLINVITNDQEADGFYPTDKIVIRKWHDNWTGNGENGRYGDGNYNYQHMIDIKEGSLKIVGHPNVSLTLDGRSGVDASGNANADNMLGTDKKIINLQDGATGLRMERVSLKRAPYCALFSHATNADTISLRLCTFEETVNRITGSYIGGAIYLYSDYDGAENTINKFELLGCTFDHNKAGNIGGAVHLGDNIRVVTIGDFVDNTGTKTRTTFTGCTSGQSGGALVFRGSFGKIEINADFTDCTATRDGGAIAFETRMTNNTGHYGRAHTINLTGCNFTRCIAYGTYDDDDSRVDPNDPDTWYAGMGGGVYFAVQAQKVNVTDCTFDACDARGNYVNLAGGGMCFAYWNTGIGGTESAGGSPDKEWLPAMTWTEKDKNGNNVTMGTDARDVTYGWAATGNQVQQRTTYGDVTIQGCTFKNTPDTTFQGGGFIVRTYSAMESLTVTNTVFDNCKVQASGSAVFMNNCVVGDAKFDDCTFRNCEITGNVYQGGGTLRTAGKSSGTLTLDGCKFFDNKANQAGGGLYYNAGWDRKTPEGNSYTTKAIVQDCEFRRNVALRPAKFTEDTNDQGEQITVNRSGGGIFCETQMSVTRCVFEANESLYGGGLTVGVYDANYRMFKDGEITQLKLDSNTEFFNNKAAGNLEGTAFGVNQEGGGIAVYQNSDVVISGGKIRNNQAYDGGGILVRSNCTVTMTGEVKVEDGVVTSYDGAILDNRAERRGGGIYMPTDGNSSMVMSGGYIYNNKCEQIDGTVGTECLGGGMMVRSTNTFTLDGGRIDGNAAFSGGGILAYYATKVSIKNGVLSGNTALRHGGAIYNDYSNVEVTGGEFYGNKATKGAVNYSGDLGKGGAIFNFGTASAPFTFVVTGDGANFHDNEAKESGGAVYNGGVGTVTISGGTFTANTAVVQGGGFCNDGCTVTITTGKFEENQAKDGGAIYAKGGAVTVSGGEFKSNLSTQYGGAVCFEETTSVTFENGTFDGNVSKSGGGLCIINSTVGFTGGTFENNIADRGGAAFIRSSTVTIDTITVKNNHAQADDRYGENEWLRGGGICVDTEGNGPAGVTINGGTFTGNTAERGGGLWIRINSASAQKYATLTVNGGTVSGNTATVEGGGIWIGGGDYFSDTENTSLTMNGGTISGNSTDKRGGGIWAGEQAQVSILATATTHGEVTGNTANNGGGIYITSGADLTVTNGYITYNHANQPSKGGLTTAYGISEYDLYGTGGGICVMNGSDSDLSTFTLNKVEGNNNMAIYGNTATFCADDVFANGNNTRLNVPQVADMNLAGYGFKPEGWFEDYRPNDLSYGVEINGVTIGLNMLAANGAPNSVNVMRYRSANAVQRRYMHIKPEYVSADGVNKEDAYVAMTLGIPAAADDTVVIDFGSIVSIDVWKNDLFMDEADFANTLNSQDETVHHSYIGPEMPDTQIKDGVHYDTQKPATTTENGFYQNHFRGNTNGQVYNRKNGIMTFEPEKMVMDREVTFFYMVEHNSVWYYANVTVVPATSIYFEDNEVDKDDRTLVTYHTDSAYEKLAEWQTIGTADAEMQDQDRPGASLLEGLDADNIYGYDSAYSSTATYSNGSAHWVTVTRDRTTKETTAARASFTFTGTGFDIISLCSANTGIVMVSIYKGEVVDFDNPPFNDRYVTSYMVDTHYGFVYNIETGKWELDENSTSSLYQIPVIKVDLTNVRVYEDDPTTEEYDPDYSYKDFGYGTYTAELYVANSFLEREPGYWSADFYLDAIRIYNPAGYDGIYSYEYDAVKRDADGNPMYDAEGNPLYEKVTKSNATDTIQNAYRDDQESWPVYAELRNLFIAQKDLNVEGTGGVIFIDGQENPFFEDYKSWGPNNEVYLNPGQSVAFTLDATGYAQNVASVQIGIRGLTGMGNVLIQSKGAEQNSYSKILEGKISTTDLYYDISSKDAHGNIGVANKVVLITNPEYIKDAQGDDVKNTTPISITNIKVTHSGVPQKKLTTYVRANQWTVDTAIEILTAEQLIDPVIKPEHPALSFDGLVRYHVFFSAEELGELTAEDLGLAVFGSYDPEGTVETAKDVIMGATEIDGLYMIATNGVHAKYLGDRQYFRAFAKKTDGSIVYSKMVGYSAVDYAKNALANSAEPALRQLAVAMLNYGAEAQKFFGYKTDELINKDLTADDQALVNGFHADALDRIQKADASKVGCFASTGGFTRKAPAISFKGAFEINYFFTPAYAVDSDLTLYFWNEDTYNSVTELTAENADQAVAMELKDGVYTASSDEIAAKYLDKTLYVAAVYESNGITYCSGVLPYSIAAYCQNPPADVQDLAAAAAIYGCTAKQYFGV